MSVMFPVLPKPTKTLNDFRSSASQNIMSFSKPYHSFHGTSYTLSIVGSDSQYKTKLRVDRSASVTQHSISKGTEGSHGRVVFSSRKG
jgi:hypothetical protein